MIETGWATNGSPGYWSIFLDPAGCNLGFAASDGSSVVTYLTAPIDWTTNRWHHIGLTFSITNTALYLDGVLATNGAALTVWPDTNVLASGFFIGSDTTGLAQAHGWFDDISTYNYVLDGSVIAEMFRVQSTPFDANPLNLGNFISAPSIPVFTPTLEAITGLGYFPPPVTNTTGCVTSSNVWITNFVANITNQSVTLKFSIAGGQDGALYDVFATAALDYPLTNAQWAWMGQGYHCCTYTLTLTNLPQEAAFLILGTPQDSDNDGLTDAQELLITHTDPNNPDTFGTGMSDGWEYAYFGTNNVDFYGQGPYADGWTFGQAYENGWNPFQFHTPPAPTGLTASYYGPTTNVLTSWNPSPGSVLSYTIERTLPGGGTSYFTNFATWFQDILPSGYPANGAPVYRAMATYPTGPSSWSPPVSIYPSDFYLDPKIIRGPQGNLFLVTGHLPQSIAKIRVWATADPSYTTTAEYPSWFEANYLWEDPQVFTPSISSNYCEFDATNLQSGYVQLPGSFISQYGYYDFNIQAVSGDGKLGNTNTIPEFAHDGWTVQAGAVPFLDGRTQIQQNVEFQLRATQGRQIGYEPYYGWWTNEVPLWVHQQRCIWNSVDYDESATVNYVTAGFHCMGGTLSEPLPMKQGLALDAFQPFEQNFFYANFLIGRPWGSQPWASTNDCPGYAQNEPIWLPYPKQDYPAMEVDSPLVQFSVYGYVTNGGTEPIAPLLSLDDAQWIFLGDLAQATFATYDHAVNDPWTLYADFPNLYGLNLLSVQAQAWDPFTGPPSNYVPVYPGQALTNENGSLWAFFYNVERPQLATRDYYFAREQPIGYGPYTNIDPRPGDPQFTVDATTPMMFGRGGEKRTEYRGLKFPMASWVYKAKSRWKYSTGLARPRRTMAPRFCLSCGNSSLRRSPFRHDGGGDRARPR